MVLLRAFFVPSFLTFELKQCGFFSTEAKLPVKTG